MHWRVLGPLRAVYGRLRRRFIFAGAAGSEFKATNGILQGCPLSVVMLNALVAIWARAVEDEIPQARTDAYVDDTGATARRPVYLQRVLDLTGHFATITGQILNSKKCRTYATSTPNMRPLTLGRDRLDKADMIKTVGVHIAMRGLREDVDASRIKEATVIAERIRFAPLPFEAKIQMMSSLSLAKGLYECTAASTSRKKLQRYRAAVLRGILQDVCGGGFHAICSRALG